MTEFLFGFDKFELTPEMEQRLYAFRRSTRAGFVLDGNAGDYHRHLDDMRRMQGSRIGVFAVIGTDDPVAALLAFLDAADICRDIRLLHVPEESLRRYGQDCYDRMTARAEEIAADRGIALDTDYLI